MELRVCNCELVLLPRLSFPASRATPMIREHPDTLQASTTCTHEPKQQNYNTNYYCYYYYYHYHQQLESVILNLNE